jgi:NAD dependent epimerase/dehydratase
MSKKIFISGATGFIGSHLCEMSVKKGYKVVGFDRYNSDNSYGWLKKSKYLKKIDLILGDIRDYDSVYKSMQGCDKVFHLAALIGIPYSYVSPLAYLKTNIEGTYNILESAKNLKLKNIIVTSTSEVYGSAKYLPIDEEHPLNAQSPYAASKISADQLALSYYKSFNLPVKIIRPFNTFGPRQSSRAVIPRIIIQCLNIKNRKLILGSLKPTRDFNFVEDTCEAYFDILKNKKLIGKTINVGSNTNISIENIAKKIMHLTGRKLIFIKNKKIIRPKLSEVDNLQCDNKKIKNLTNWKPRTELDNGLKKTIKWIRDNYSEYSEKYEI